MEGISAIAASSLTIAVAAFVFWALDRQFGSFLMLNFVGSSLLNQTVKLTACVYRPWVRDPRIVPDPSAIESATGYSFPSGHTQSATAIYGSIALWFGKKRKWLAALMVAMILLTAFSRNYLGVHTPQDVFVAMVLCGAYLWLNSRILARLRRQPSFDKTVALVGMVLSLAAVLWFIVKDYPMDYQNSVLLVDPEEMMEDGFKSAGMVLGFFPGWLIERRWLRFSTRRHSVGQIVISAAALVPMLVIYEVMPGLLAGAMGPLWSCYVSCAFLAFYVTALVPAVLCLLQRRGILPS